MIWTNFCLKVIIRVAIIVTGVALMAIGIWQGELTAILRKAVVVCLECIGIG